MPKPLRYSLAAIAGVLVAFAVIAALEALGQVLFPTRGRVDLGDPAAVVTYVQGMSIGAILFVLAGWLLATFAGSLIAGFVAGKYRGRVAATVGFVVLAATVANFIAIPHPIWFTALAVLTIPL
ncbi:MAG: hypothetical protein H7Y19_09855, partial [Luteimonas sp.]|nr:hypothetical protein [Luteimonas sp.]